jgi:hypothetical protein
VFITSRPERSTREAFGDDCLESHSNIFILHFVDRHLVDDDIQRFLNARLHEMAKRRGMKDLSPGWPPQKLVGDLVQKASGIFIYASTLCKVVDSPGDIEQKLTKITQLSTSENEGRLGIDQLYWTVLKSAMADILDMDVGDWHFVLGTIILLQNPLSLTDISRLLGFTRAHVAGLLMGLHSVLAMPPIDDNHGVVHTIHASFHDFLTDEKRCLDTKMVVRPTIHHGDLGLCLFKHMMQGLRRNICGTDGFKFNREVVDLADRRKKCIDGSLAYACCHWADHLVHTPQDGCQTDQLVAALDDFAK